MESSPGEGDQDAVEFPKLECRDCKLTFWPVTTTTRTYKEATHMLANHKLKFCIGSGYEDPETIKQVIHLGEQISAGHVQNPEQAAEALEKCAPGYRQLVSDFAQRELELKSLQRNLEVQRTQQKTDAASELERKQNEMKATMEKDARKMRELQVVHPCVCVRLTGPCRAKWTRRKRRRLQSGRKGFRFRRSFE